MGIFFHPLKDNFLVTDPTMEPPGGEADDCPIVDQGSRFVGPFVRSKRQQNRNETMHNEFITLHLINSPA